MVQRCREILNCATLLVVLLTVATAAHPADFKAGTYSVTAGGVKYSIKFDDSNRLTVTRGGEVAVEGTYKVSGDEIEVIDEKGPIACRGNEKTGRYKWKLEEKKLILTKVEDGCEGRAKALSAQAWERE